MSKPPVNKLLSVSFSILTLIIVLIFIGWVREMFDTATIHHNPATEVRQ
jgi:hypothetical protein